MRGISTVARDDWDYTTLDHEILDDAARPTEKDLLELARPGFSVKFSDTRESFFTAEALEYVWTWQPSTDSSPAGICGPIGPTEQLPLVAQIVNDLEIDVRSGHFGAMDEWFADGTEVPRAHPLSFARADNLREYTASYDRATCLVMQGGQGEVKHWAFNDPVRREGRYADAPPTPMEYRRLSARIVDLHPMTIIQNARTSSGGVVSAVPRQALTVGPVETWKAKKASIWHPGWHDNPFGMRLTALMISKRAPDSSVPMSLPAEHPDVQFSYLRDARGVARCAPRTRGAPRTP